MLSLLSNVMKKQVFLTALISVVIGSSAFAQDAGRTPKSVESKTISTVPTAPESEIKADSDADSNKKPAKKNERAHVSAENELENQTNYQKKNGRRDIDKLSVAVAKPMPFAYEFSQPKFNISRVIIEHDANGKGQITFQKKELKESLTDPLQFSAAALERIKILWNALDFLNSTENYQAEKQFPHLGTMKLRENNGERTREAEFNWTENKTANDLTNEYKKITEQSIWIFDMNLARENQPLSAPQLVGQLESMVNRNQISDAEQMLPFLREIVDDERLPLIARNRTSKIIKQSLLMRMI
jgi:hypothetical protein